jgi:hypothetical protein
MPSTGDVKFCMAFLHSPGTYHSKDELTLPADVQGRAGANDAVGTTLQHQIERSQTHLTYARGQATSCAVDGLLNPLPGRRRAP